MYLPAGHRKFLSSFSSPFSGQGSAWPFGGTAVCGALSVFSVNQARQVCSPAGPLSCPSRFPEPGQVRCRTPFERGLYLMGVVDFDFPLVPHEFLNPAEVDFRGLVRGRLGLDGTRENRQRGEYRCYGFCGLHVLTAAVPWASRRTGRRSRRPAGGPRRAAW